MSEDTSFTKAGNAVTKHGNKVFNGLSAAAIVWMFATFATKEVCNENGRRCEGGADKCEQKRSRQWQKIADLELDVERLKVRIGLISDSNETTVAVNQRNTRE